MSPAIFTLLLKGLDLLVLGIEMAPNIRRAFKQVTADVQRMVEEGRNPTDAEWAELDNLRDVVHNQIQKSGSGDRIG